jgi:hypothetical protein
MYVCVYIYIYIYTLNSSGIPSDSMQDDYIFTLEDDAFVIIN